MNHPNQLSELEQQACVYFEHHVIDVFEELSTLYNLRVSRTKQRLTVIDEVHEVDTRIDAALQYLNQYTQSLQHYTDEAFEQAKMHNTMDAADAFAFGLCAFNSKNRIWIEQVVTFFKDLPDMREGIAYALFFLPWECVSQWVADFLHSKDFAHKWLALSACQKISVYPAKQIGSLITREDCQADPVLFSMLINSVGNAQDKRFIEIIKQASQHDNMNVKTAALRARLMLKDRTALTLSQSHSLTDNGAFHVLSPWIILSESSGNAKLYLSTVMKTQDIAYDLKILAIGYHGDPALLDWLLKTTDHHLLQPLLALVFTQITGLDVSQLAQRETQHDEDDEQHDLFLHEDHSLPNTQRVCLVELWQNIQSQFNVGERYFFGRSLQQRQRFSLTKGNASYIICEKMMQYYTVLTHANAKYTSTIAIKRK